MFLDFTVDSLDLDLLFVAFGCLFVFVCVRDPSAIDKFFCGMMRYDTMRRIVSTGAAATTTPLSSIVCVCGVCVCVDANLHVTFFFYDLTSGSGGSCVFVCVLLLSRSIGGYVDTLLPFM